MIRLLHRWPGLAALLLVVLLSLSGAALSVFPAADSLSAPQADAAMSVADLASRVRKQYPEVDVNAGVKLGHWAAQKSTTWPLE